MAEIVLGIGCAHGPLLSTPPEKWDLRARADRENKSHWYRGNTYDYDSLLKERAPGFTSEITADERRERFIRCRTAMEALARKFNEATPEAIVIVGNDQREFFGPDLTPSVTIFNGDRIRNIQHLHENSPGLNIAEPGNAPPDEGAEYTGAPELANHLLRSLNGENFDIAQSSSIPKGSIRGGIPHAYGFLYHSLLGDNPPPSVPVILNVHFPWNVMRNQRCLDLGRALQRAVRSFAGCKRVAMMASGGLSHYVIDEELDRKVLTALETGDEPALAAIPENVFKVGTAEIKNWFPVMSAMAAEGRKWRTVDYVPCYRSEAGTGTGMGFGYWE
jgi:hypothetical protein